MRGKDVRANRPFPLSKKTFENSRQIIFRFAPKVEHFRPWTERFYPWSERFRPWTERFCPWTESFTPRTERHCPRTESFTPRTERFCPRTERFCPKVEAFRPKAEKFSFKNHIIRFPVSDDLPLSDRNSPAHLINLRAAMKWRSVRFPRRCFQSKPFWFRSASR